MAMDWVDVTWVAWRRVGSGIVVEEESVSGKEEEGS